MNYHPIESETWDILGGHLQIVNFEEKKLVDILEIPMWNTFPSKHTTTFFHFCVRLHLGILFMLTKTTLKD